MPVSYAIGRLRASPLALRLASGGVWSLAGDIVARALAFAGSVLVARWLGVVEYGAFALIQSAIGMMAVFAQFGLGHTATRFIATTRDCQPYRIEAIASITLAFAVLTGLVTTFLLFSGASLLARNWLNEPQLAPWLQLVAPVLLLNAVGGVFAGIVLGFEVFRRYARLIWLVGLAQFALTVVGLLLFGLPGAVSGLVLSEFVRCACLFLLARNVMRERGHHLRWTFDRAEAALMGGFSVPLLLGSILHAPVMFLCHSFIIRGPGGLAQLGLYDAGQKWMTLVMMVPLGTSAAFAPILANLLGTGDTAYFRSTTLRLAALQFIATAIPAAMVAFSAPWLVRLYGEGFYSAVPVIVIQMFLAPLFVLRHLYWQALTSGGHPWVAAFMSALWAVIAITATWIWRDRGALGLSWAMLTAYGASLACCIAAVERRWGDGVDA